MAEKKKASQANKEEPKTETTEEAEPNGPTTT